MNEILKLPFVPASLLGFEAVFVHKGGVGALADSTVEELIKGITFIHILSSMADHSHIINCVSHLVSLVWELCLLESVTRGSLWDPEEKPIPSGC